MAGTFSSEIRDFLWVVGSSSLELMLQCKQGKIDCSEMVLSFVQCEF